MKRFVTDTSLVVSTCSLCFRFRRFVPEHYALVCSKRRCGFQLQALCFGSLERTRGSLSRSESPPSGLLVGKLERDPVPLQHSGLHPECCRMLFSCTVSEPCDIYYLVCIRVLEPSLRSSHCQWSSSRPIRFDTCETRLRLHPSPGSQRSLLRISTTSLEVSKHLAARVYLTRL